MGTSSSSIKSEVVVSSRRASTQIFGAALSALGALTVVACDSDDGKKDSGSAGSDAMETGGGPGIAGGGGTGNDSRVGNFDVELNAADPTTSRAAYTSVFGVVRDGAVNEAIVWDLAQSLDDCDLLTPRAPFCDPQCDVSSTCVEDGMCLPNPTAHSVGTVTFTGLGSEAGGPIVVSPTAGSNTYMPSGAVTVLYPPAAEGAAIQVSTEGGDYAPFTVTGTGIAPLTMLNQLNADQKVDMSPDQDLALQWAPPGAASDARIEIEIDISHHGGARGLVRCFVDDTGSFSVPQALVSGLVDLGVAGFPTVMITRRSRGSVAIEPGRVDLDVFASAILNLNIPGYVSCREDAHCVAVGMTTCQNDRTCI
jgi:hypothetical protein